MRKRRIMNINGAFVEMRGSTLVKILSEEEVKEVRCRTTPQYKAKRLNNMELLDAYLNSLIDGNEEAAVIYKTEVLFRMRNK